MNLRMNISLHKGIHDEIYSSSNQCSKTVRGINAGEILNEILTQRQIGEKVVHSNIPKAISDTTDPHQVIFQF
jgi:hypothetical protein